MPTPHHRIHRLAATGGVLLALVAALPAGVNARPFPADLPSVAAGAPVLANPDNRASVPEPVPAVTVRPNPDNRLATAAGTVPDNAVAGGGEVLPHTNWLTPLPTPAAPAPRPAAASHPVPTKSAGGVSLAIPLGFAGAVGLAAFAAAAARRRRGARIPA
jgi:hypothetical protein